MMNITIDCRMLGASGVGVYLRECLPWLLDSANGFILLGNKEKLSAITGDHQNVQILDCRIKPFSMRELFAFPRGILKKINQTDLYYSP
jgi:hypothetical protein